MWTSTTSSAGLRGDRPGANDVVNSASAIYGMPDPGGLQGQDGDREQALDGLRLRGPEQRAVLHGQDRDGLR